MLDLQGRWRTEKWTHNLVLRPSRSTVQLFERKALDTTGSFHEKQLGMTELISVWGKPSSATE